MKLRAALIAPVLSICVALSSCGTAPEATSTEKQADDFAARINGPKSSQPAPATQTPRVAEPLPNAAPGAYAPGTATDPESATCGANTMGDFLGKPADDATRQAIMSATQGVREVRFIAPGSDYVRPDPTHPRLNIMIDNLGIIRDARCG